MSDFFDTMGTIDGGGPAGRASSTRMATWTNTQRDPHGGLRGQPSWAASSAQAPSPAFAESTSGAAAGARTGLSNIVIALAFFVCAFLAPIIGMVSSSATCGALVVVGYLMMSDIGKIDWGSLEAAIPAFVTIMGIPFTYSITNGIGFGFITYVVVKVTQGHWREVKPLMWIVSVAFLLTFVAFS